MKNNWRNNLVALSLVMLAILSACSTGRKHAEHADAYTCPMHYTVVSEGPGLCPVCGMDLVRKSRAGEEVEITEDLAKLLKSPNESVVGTIKTIKLTYKTMPVNIEAHGIVTYDTRNIYTISARVAGRLEKVFLKSAFQPVSKGQKLAEIYSPELITAERELLYLIESDAQNLELIAAAKNKILLFGASLAQINALIEKREVPNTFAVYSPFSGYLVPLDGQAPAANTFSTSANASGEDMSSSSALSSPTGVSVAQMQSASLLREGSYVAAGQSLFKVANPSSLRIELDLPASKAGSVARGSKIQLDFGTDQKREGVIDFIQPFFNNGQQFVKLRVYTKETEHLHIGHLVTAKLSIETSESQWVPKEAVLDLGLNQIVFVKDRGVFKPKKITTGTKAEGWIEVKGLSSSDEIAVNAQYLIDADSFIKFKE